MTADFSLPAVTQTEADYAQAIRNLFVALALCLDTTVSNTPTNAIKWNSTNSRFEKFNGTTWAALVAKYLIDVDTLDGLHSSDLALVGHNHAATYQAIHANLTALSGLSLIADRLPYANGTGTLALATLTAAGRALLDDASAAAQRTTLGLTGLASLALTADKVLYINSAGAPQLLALGAAGTVLTSGGDTAAPTFAAGASTADNAARDLAVFNSFLNQIDLGRASGAIPSGYMHLFLTDELATKTNAYYDAAGDYYTNVYDSATDVAPSATITYTGLINLGTTAALVDGNNTTMFSLKGAANNSFIFDFGAGGKNIRSLTYIINGGSFSQNVKLQYSDDDTTYTDTNVTSAVVAVNSTGVTAAVNDYGVHQYWKISSLNSSNAMQATTVNLYERIRVDMTLVPTAITAGSAPETVDIYLLHKAVDAATANTDLKARVSRDNGSNWSAHVTLAEVCQYDADYKLLKGTADLSALASGTSVAWEITTLNAKAQRVRVAAMLLD